MTRRLVAEFARRPSRSGPEPARLPSLTAREREVLQALAQGMSNAEMAEALFVGEATVKSHVVVPGG